MSATQGVNVSSTNTTQGLHDSDRCCYRCSDGQPSCSVSSTASHIKDRSLRKAMLPTRKQNVMSRLENSEVLYFDNPLITGNRSLGIPSLYTPEHKNESNCRRSVRVAKVGEAKVMSYDDTRNAKAVYPRKRPRRGRGRAKRRWLQTRSMRWDWEITAVFLTFSVQSMSCSILCRRLHTVSLSRRPTASQHDPLPVRLQ